MVALNGRRTRSNQSLLIVEWLPFKSSKLALKSFIEWGNYMNEIYESKIQDARNGKPQEGMDLMGES